MNRYSARDAAKNFGALIDAANVETVVIQRYGRPRAAVVGWQLYNAYKRAHDEKIAAMVVRKLESRLAAVGDGAPASEEKARLDQMLVLARDLAAPRE
jgi:hypothetical protein